jgi:BlaI family transcriptional regulator, penicillinase repressor
MKKPEGNLTPVQYQIMEAVWRKGDAGAPVVEIWQAVRADRSVGRTTVLNLVDRLEKRGWLLCSRENRPNRYLAAVTREDTAALLAGEFVNDFFSGSAGNLVMSLLGSKRLSRDDIAELSKLLENAAPKPTAPKSNKKQEGRQ